MSNQQPQPKRKAWPVRHKVLTGLMTAGALIVIITAASASNKSSTPVADTGAASSFASPSAAVSSASASSAPTSSAFSPAAVSSAAGAAPATPAAPASPSMTSAQQQAVDSAQSYLSEGQGFSKQGLIQQLTSSSGSGFTEAQAEYAASTVGL